MALPQRIRDLGEVPDFLHEYYTVEGDEYLLNVQPVPAGEDLAGLKSALASERKQRRDAEAAVKEVQSRYSATPDEVQMMRQQLDAIKDKRVLDDQGFETAVQQRLDRVVTERDRQIAALTQERDRLSNQRREDRLSLALRSAASQDGVVSSAYDDVVARGLRIFTDVDEAGDPIAREANGDIRYAPDGVSRLQPQHWLKDLRGQAPHFWPVSNGAGAGQGEGGGRAGAIVLTKAQVRDVRVYEQAKARAQQQGVELQVED